MSDSVEISVFIKDHKNGEDIHLKKVWIGGSSELVIGDPDTDDIFFIGALNALELAQAIVQVATAYSAELEDKLIGLGVTK